MRKIPCPVQQPIRLDMFTEAVFAAVNIGGNAGEPGYQVHGIIEYCFPIILFIHARRIFFSKLAFGLKRHDTGYELGHWMGVERKRFESIEYMCGHMGSSLQNGGCMVHIVFSRQFTYQHQVEQSFRKGLFSIGRFGKFLLQFRD